MLTAFAEAARGAALMLERLALWRGRAGQAATTKAGRAVIEALALQPAASTKGIAAGSGMTSQAINAAARALRAQDLIAEATGQTRFRLWQARI